MAYSCFSDLFQYVAIWFDIAQYLYRVREQSFWRDAVYTSNYQGANFNVIETIPQVQDSILNLPCAEHQNFVFQALYL
jgi:hypothetical protein